MPDEKRFTDRKLNINQPYIIGLILIVLTFVVFYPTLENDFINYDDQLYVTANLKVQAGLTQGGFIWAFTNLEASNWHPLTWLSHMLDCQLFGLNPKGHHLTNILFHTANTLLLFLFLNRSTGSLWRSSFVAALFAIHPLHVESVAWIAERKDVLSTFFWMLTMYFYIRYARNPGIMKYSLVLLFFLLGLMSKPMVVTLPFVLLLLDFWPLCRIQSLQPNRNHTAHFTKHINPHRKYTKPLHLVLEKIPLFLISAIFSIITLIAQIYGETVAPLTHLPIGLRISNAFYSYIGYIIKMVFPIHLSVLYPLADVVFNTWQTVTAGLLLSATSILVLRLTHRFPYMSVGWLWYLGTLVPVIGLVQVGIQSMADRYTYIPLIGLFIMTAWGFADIVKKWHFRTSIPFISMGIVILLITCTGFQITHWFNSITLFKHTLNVTSNNPIAHKTLGDALTASGREEEAIPHFYESLKTHPKPQEILNSIGIAVTALGKLHEASQHYKNALQIDPDYIEPQINLGTLLLQQGRMDESAGYFLSVLRIDPEDARVHNNLGIIRSQQGHFADALAHFKKALEIDPGHKNARMNLNKILKLHAAPILDATKKGNRQ